MKKFFIFLSVLSAGATFYNAQNINFPDANFKAAIIKAYPAVDANKDNQISEDEAKTLTGIRNLANYPNIVDATGIEFFTNITELNLGGLLNLNKIDVSKNVNLKSLNLRNNKLTGTLDISKLDNLTNLELNNNQISEVIFPQSSKLKIVYINDNKLTNIDLSTLKDLQRLFLVNNQLTALNLKENINIERIHINNNQIASLDLSGLTKLNWFSAESNQLGAIKFSNNPLLKTILAKDNRLISFDFKDGFTNNITTINVEANPGFNLIKKDCNDIVTAVTNAVIEDDCEVMSTNEASKNVVKVYPTLVKDFMTINNIKDINTYQIIDYSGRVVKAANLQNNTLDVSALQKGNYILILKNKEKSISHTFIKQ